MDTWSAITPVHPGHFMGPQRVELKSTGGTLMESDIGRRGVVLCNPGKVDVYVSPREDVSPELHTWCVPAGDSLPLPAPIYTGPLYACSKGPVGVLLVTSFRTD